MPSSYEHVQDQPALEALCAALAEKSWICVDTEFLREKTYRPVLCLVQIKSGDITAVIDALALDNLTPLVELLDNNAITKVFHAAGQDLEIFYELMKKVPAPVFDTQIAAPLLGYAEQIGYGNLVMERLGTQLSKSHTRADWTRRPLPDSQLQYALDDVIYLESLYLSMRDELEQKNRLAWLEPEFDALLDDSNYLKPASSMWKKVKNAQRLKGESLAVLQSLAAWRELTARERNLPRSWIIKDDVLTDIARQLPATTEDLGYIRGIGKSVLSKHGDRIVERIAAARNTPPEPWPAFTKKQPKEPEHEAVVLLLEAIIRQQSITLDINAGLLAPKKLLEACVSAGSAEPLKGWRSKLLSDTINPILSGHMNVSVSNGRLAMRGAPE